MHKARKIFDVTVWTIGIAAALALLTHEALADGKPLAAENPTYKAECGSCHIAYPPALLSGDSWKLILNGLDRHFGTEATIDQKSRAEIGAFLKRNAGRAMPGTAKPSLRITDTSWFRHEHDEVPPSAWKSATVRSPANCVACHKGAGNGDFSERAVRVPQ